MGTSTIYLLPENGSVDPTTFGKTVKAVLTEMGVICDELYDDEPNWFCAGSDSSVAFDRSDEDDDVAFEYCIIYASKNTELVPQDPAVEPLCPQCDAELREEYYELINSIEEKELSPAKKSQRYLHANIACPACRCETLLTKLKDEVGIFLSGTWINFEDVQSSLSPKWLKKFEAATGFKFKVLNYGYT